MARDFGLDVLFQFRREGSDALQVEKDDQKREEETKTSSKALALFTKRGRR